MWGRNGIGRNRAANPANKAMNRILTYGLIVFFLYAMYNDNQKNHKAQPAPERNYTHIDWHDYVTVRNLVTGEESFRKLEDNKLDLVLNKQDLKGLESAEYDEDGNLQLFEIETDSSFSVYSLVGKRH